MTRLIYPTIAIGAGAILGMAVLAVSDLSPTWIALLIIALLYSVIAAWSADRQRLLLHGFLFTVPMDISKGLIAEHGVFGPGLSLVLSDIFLAGFLAVWLLHKVAAREWIRGDRANGWAVVFLVLMWLSSFYSPDVWAGVFSSLSYTKYIITFVVLRDYLDSRQRFHGALTVLAYGLLLQVGVAFAQVASNGGFQIQGMKTVAMQASLSFEGTGGLSHFRAIGLLSHPISFAAYLLLPLTVLFGLSLMRGRIAERIWWRAVALLLAGGVALACTLSRGGWIAMAAAVLWYLFVGWRRRVVGARQIASLAIMAAVVAALLAVFYPAFYLRMVEDDQGSSLSRWLLLDQAKLIIADAPMLGVGLGGYVTAAQDYTPSSFAVIPEVHQKILRGSVVHNKYVLTAAEHGLLVMAFIVWLYTRFAGAALAVRRWATPLEQVLALSLSAAIIGQMVLFLFDHFYIGTLEHLLWITFALLGSVTSLQGNTAGATCVAADSYLSPPYSGDNIVAGMRWH